MSRSSYASASLWRSRLGEEREDRGDTSFVLRADVWELWGGISPVRGVDLAMKSHKEGAWWE
jgi:hypothetical protein